MKNLKLVEASVLLDDDMVYLVPKHLANAVRAFATEHRFSSYWHGIGENAEEICRAYSNFDLKNGGFRVFIEIPENIEKTHLKNAAQYEANLSVGANEDELATLQHDVDELHNIVEAYRHDKELRGEVYEKLQKLLSYFKNE